MDVPMRRNLCRPADDPFQDHLVGRSVQLAAARSPVKVRLGLETRAAVGDLKFRQQGLTGLCMRRAA
jgi:hypothetical protein